MYISKQILHKIFTTALYTNIYRAQTNFTHFAQFKIALFIEFLGFDVANCVNGHFVPRVLSTSYCFVQLGNMY